MTVTYTTTIDVDITLSEENKDEILRFLFERLWKINWEDYRHEYLEFAWEEFMEVTKRPWHNLGEECHSELESIVDDIKYNEFSGIINIG